MPNDLIPTDEEQERLDAELEEAWDDAQNMIDQECSCWYDNDCPYHAKDRVLQRHEIERTI